MPKFEITSPDGSRFEVTAPDGATDAEVLEYAKRNAPMAKPAEPDAKPTGSGWLPTAVARGLGDLAGTVRDIGDLRQNLLRKISPTAADIQDARPQLRNMLPTGEQAGNAIMGAAGITPTEPQTAAGRIGADAVRFATGSALGGSLAGLGRNMLAGAVSGLGAGGAGELSGQNGAARFAGSLAPTGLGLIRNAVRGNPIREAATALESVTPGQMDEANRIAQNAAQAGSRVTMPEAVQQATGARMPALAAAQDLAQSSVGGRRVMSPFLAERNQGAEAAARELPGMVNPNPMTNPQTAPLILQKEAAAETQAARTARSTAVRPIYKEASDAVTADPKVAARVDFAVNKTLARLDQLAANTPALQGPINRFRDRMAVGQQDWEALQDVRREIRDMTRARAENGMPVLDRKLGIQVGDEIRSLTNNLHMTVPKLRQADATYIRLTRDVVEPVEQGIIGRIAQSGGDQPSMAQQRALMFPPEPSGGAIPTAPSDTGRAVASLSGASTARKRADLEAMGATRTAMASEIQARLDDALKLRATGRPETPGANVASRLAPTDSRQKAIEEGLRALPGGDDAATGFRRLMEVFNAQAFQPRANSATQPRAEAMRRSGLPSVSPRQWLDDWVANGNTEALAKAITAPDGFQTLRALAHIDDAARREAVISGLLAANRAETATEATIPDVLVTAPRLPQR